jgi:hypothetical protein
VFTGLFLYSAFSLFAANYHFGGYPAGEYIRPSIVTIGSCLLQVPGQQQDDRKPMTNSPMTNQQLTQ